MRFVHAPLLQVQRDLYTLPRGMERFRAYIATMTGGTDDLVLPLVAMNPMGKEHVAAMLDALLAVGAEAAAGRAVAGADARLARSAAAELAPAQLRVGLVLADDLKGGWTERHLSEAQHVFGAWSEVKRGWSTATLWTSEAPSLDVVEREARAACYRAAHVARFGTPRTLREHAVQEGRVARFAGIAWPALSAATRAVLAPLLDARDNPTIVAAMYGDEVARKVGHRPLGVPERAGFGLGLEDAAREDVVAVLSP
jgi:hypothetical protein